MCWQCDHPEATTDDYLDLVRGIIDRSGWFIQVVERERWRPGFAYTVGLTGLGRPELVVTGQRPREAGTLLNSVAHHLVCHDGGGLRAGGRLPLSDHPEIEVVRVAEPTVHLVMASRIYGPDVRGHQLVYADDRGRWPWETGFRGNQPVLGVRVTR
jgi:hypothetical protein